MRKLGLGLIAALAVLIMGCVEAEPDRTNVVVKREAAPSTTTVVKDSGGKAPETNIDVNVDSTDKNPPVVTK